MPFADFGALLPTLDRMARLGEIVGRQHVARIAPGDDFAGEQQCLVESGAHLLDVVQSICTRVALFNRGRIGFTGTVEELSSRVADSGFAIEVAADGIDIASLAADLPGVTVGERTPEGRWQLAAQSDIRPELARRVIAGGGQLRSLDAHRLALGEAYTRYFEEAGHEEA